MGRKRRSRGRDVQGILLFDKPAGMSSNAALQEVKNLYFAQKAGHTGSLDPLATGLLPICFGQATRVSGFLLDADKQYTVTCQLGIRTTTGDAEGEITETRPVQGIDREMIETLLQEKFTGQIEQIPPMYSALKHKGQRLYELARQGIEIEREPRQVTIHTIQLIDFVQDEIVIDVRCSKGTYVRTLAEDIGEALGVGAHVKYLRRTAVAPFNSPEMYTLDTLKELREKDLKQLNSLLLPTESALVAFPDIHLSTDSTYYLKMGQAVQVPRAPTSGWVRLYGGDDEFLGMGMIQDDGKVAPKRLFS
ncbi:MAG: tRNA pseudouridine(55) synthase TruB [Gammaproteobacteria bacterium]|nr:MAG: tRNA pseudouridine(55) synthase TruB [Gammaproteobacteria bacterium]